MTSKQSDTLTETGAEAAVPLAVPPHLRRLVLTGFMGAGKSTIGRLLASRLGWTFLDLDAHLEQRTGATIPQLFERHGEARFRRLESTALASALGRSHTVLALGGGTPEGLTNRLLLEQTPATFSIFLDAPFPVLFDRCMLQGIGRPVLEDPDAAQVRFATRHPLYLRLAHLTVDTTASTPEETVDFLIAALNKTSHFPLSEPLAAHYLHPNVSTHRRITLATSTPDLNSDENNSRKSVRGHILFCIGVLLALYLAWHLLKELEIIYVSALFAVVLSPAVTRITRLEVRGSRPSRGVAIVLLIAAALLLLTLFFAFGLPPVVHDLREFTTELPQRIPMAVARINKLPFAAKLNIDSMVQRAEGALTTTAGYLFTSLPTWLSHVFDILTTAFLCIYFMLEGEYAYRFFLSLFPYPQRKRLDTTLQRAELKVSRWLFGQGLLMLILGVSSTIVFGLLHVRYFLLLGVLMGLFNIVPIAGGIVTMALVAGVAALDSWTKMAGVLIFYAIYVNVENAYLTPRIMRSSVNLMGLTVLIALLCGTALAGVVGALVAVPTAALVSVLLDEYAVQKEWR